MSNLVYIFLDIDGVLNDEQYIIECYEKHHKPMHMNHVPFDPKCLNNLANLVYTLEKNNYKIEIILSSTWRLDPIDYEIVNARLAEYGLRLKDKTPNINHERGFEIQEFLKDKEYNNVIILDDEWFDINKYYPNNLIIVNPKIGLQKEDVVKALSILHINRGDITMESKKEWNEEAVDNSMDLETAEDIVDKMYQYHMGIIQEGDIIFIDKLQEVKLTRLEFASVRLLREVQSLERKLKHSIEIEEVNRAIKELTDYFKNYPDDDKILMKANVLQILTNLNDVVGGEKE